MNEGPDLAYNQSVPADWWLTSWRPSQWCYGMNTYGGSWGAGTDDDACQTNNAYCLAVYLRKQGWCLQSIAGVCGNIMSESGFDPRNWQVPGDSSEGFGLVQWTPGYVYHNDASGIWGPTDGWAPYYYSGWYESFFIASEVFGYPRAQWESHRKGPGYNPAPGSGGVYPGYAPDMDYTLTYEEFALGKPSDSDAEGDIEDRVRYYAGAYYWDYEQVADYTADYTIWQRKNRAWSFYLRLRNIFPDFKSFRLKNPCDAVNEDTTLADIEALPSAGGSFYAVLAANKQRRIKRVLKII